MKRKISKGRAGYIRQEQIRRLLITAILFILPIGLFLIGLHVTKTRLNLMTVIAALGCLPACRSAVNLILIFMQKPVEKEVLKETSRAAGDLVQAQELVFTAYEHNTPINALVVCGNEVVCYTPSADTDTSYVENHIRKILSANHFTDVNVKVFKDLKAYCQRVTQIRKNPKKYREGIRFQPDSRYPDLSREELILHTLYAISL